MSKASFILRVHPAQYGNSTFIQGEALIRNHQLHVKFHLIANTKAGRTGSEGVVEGEASRLYFFNACAVKGAGKIGGELKLFSI